VAAKMPDKLKEMQTLFYAEAAKYHVLPARQLVADALERAEAEPHGGGERNSPTREL